MRPIYIICAQSGATDKASNLEIFFKVLEKLKYSGVRPEGPAAPHNQVPFRMVAAWLRTPDDPPAGAMYNVEVAARMQGSDENVILRGQRAFEGEIFRITIEGHLPLAPNFPSAGIYELECRIRHEQGDWNRQAYPIIIEPLPAPSEQQAAAASIPQPSAD